jgi:two-component system response regulator MprA
LIARSTRPGQLKPNITSPQDAESTPLATQRALILVVERDPNVRDLEAYFLEEAGYTVDFADDGLVALQRASADHPSIIITEILVPKLDGLALCRKLKADPATKDIAVLIFSFLMAESRAREAGADAYLRKPLVERRLVETVQELLQLRAGHRLKESV